MIALDASALIAYLDSGDVHHAAARDAVLRGGPDALCASVVSLAEALVGPVRTGCAEAVRAAVRALRVLPVALEAGDEVALAELRAQTGLRMPDVCVLRAARVMRAEVLTFDLRLREAAPRLGLGVVAR